MKTNTSQSETVKFNLVEEVAKAENLREIINSSGSPDDQRTSKAKIQKVPIFLRERPKFCHFYSPKLLSIGPIHHHDDNLKLGEQYKLMWTTMYLTRVNGQQSRNWKIRDEYENIKDEIVKVIERCYSEEVIEEYKNKYKCDNYEALAWMLFVDGCSVLEFMNKASYENPGALKIKIDQLILMQQDLLLLENQIPFEILKLLCPFSNELSESMHNFVKLNQMMPERLSSPPVPLHPQPTHLLDYLRKILCDDQTAINIPPKNQQKDEWTRNRNIQELKSAGIKVEECKCNIREIYFSPSLFLPGKLYLPRLVVDDSTGTIFSNLIAHEMCPDFKNDFTISSYVAFLDSLIDHPEDVKELRGNGIVYNNLGSDQEVADLFNTITTDLVPDPRMYEQVKRKMEEHCNNPLKTWMAEFTYTHFQSPWSVLALLAAILLLALTIVQTYYTIPHP